MLFLNKINSKNNPINLWKRWIKSILLIFVGGGIDTIGFIGLFGFFTNHVTGNLVMAGASLATNGEGLWIKLAAIPLFIITVAFTKFFIDITMKRTTKHMVLYYLFFIEGVFLVLLMISGLYFSPFTNPDSIYVALTAFLGMIALAIRNTSGRSIMHNYTPGTVMTGNTTALGINITNYLSHKTEENKLKLIHSIYNIVTFVFGSLLGAFLFNKVGFWCLCLFIPPVFYLAFLSKKEDFLEDDD